MLFTVQFLSKSLATESDLLRFVDPIDKEKFKPATIDNLERLGSAQYLLQTGKEVVVVHK